MGNSVLKTPYFSDPIPIKTEEFFFSHVLEEGGDLTSKFGSQS